MNEDGIDLYYNVDEGCFVLRDGTEIRNIRVVNLEKEEYGTAGVRYWLRAQYDPPPDEFVNMQDVRQEIADTFINR